MAIIIMLPVFYVTVFQVKKLVVQKEMQLQLKQRQLVTIQIAENNIHWHKVNKELTINGELFDVESIIIKDGYATIKGLYDKHEKQIEDQLRLATTSAQQNAIDSMLTKMLQLIYVTNIQIDSPQFALSGNNISYTIWPAANKLPLNTIAVPTPPPLG